MDDIMKIIKSLKEFGLSLKGISETIQNEAKEQIGRFLGTLLGKLGASLLVYMLAGKGINRTGYGNKKDGIIRAGYGSKNEPIRMNLSLMEFILEIIYVIK